MPIVVNTPDGPLKFPDGTTDAEIEEFLNAEKPPSKVDDALRAKGLSEADLSALDKMDADTKRAVPGGMALAGGFFGGIPGAGLGAYVGHRLTGDDIGTSAVSAGANMAIPAVANAALSAPLKAAVPLARRGIKPALGMLRRRAGVEGVTSDAMANRIAKFTLQEGLKSSDDAAALVSNLEREIQNNVKPGPAARAPIDLPERLPRYLNKFMGRVEKQLNRAQVRPGVQNFMRDVMTDSPVSRAVPRAASAGSIGDAGKALVRALRGGKAPDIPAGSAREIRPDISPSEGLDIVRAKSFFDPNASPSASATGKVVERAIRDGVKQASPEAAPLLRRQGRALDAKRVLDEMAVRMGNRDAIGLPAAIGAAPAMAGGGPPVLGLLMQLLREGQFAAGHAAYKVGQPLSRAAGPTKDALSKLVALLSSHDGGDQ